MPVRINNIKLSLDEDTNALVKKASKSAGIEERDISNFHILKEAVDARKKDKIELLYHVEFDCPNEEKVVKRASSSNVLYESRHNVQRIVYGSKILEHRPVIVGSGPAGLFAGLLMSQNGYNPIILERGEQVEKRTETIRHFWRTGILDTDSNVQFGEGGAGTFSDGKLTTRIKDPHIGYVLEEFVKSGAPEEIIYSGKPHIGTDILKDVVRNIRNVIIELGGEIRFRSKITGIKTVNGRIVSLTVNDEYEQPCSIAVMALGHSARDTYEMLLSSGMILEQKPFAIGARIEHAQRLIDESQYGNFAGHPRLPAADYRLTYNDSKLKRPCYTFCMCPGGVVVPAASEENKLVTNGMSEYKRDKENANSALLVGVGPGDFASSHPLAGVEFQRHYEGLAYKAGGGGYIAPVQLVGDFLKDNVSTRLKGVTPSYERGWVFSSLKECLPSYVIDVMKEGLISFDRKIKGFAADGAVLTGIETRSSSPVRMVRNEGYESVGIQGIYPCGEGAGYAGGIMSAAVDGIRVATRIMESYRAAE
jgi:uncharacterized FAD-dependent dehydrogenase